MADKKITQLNALLEADVAPLDVAAVADISANETRKVTTPDLVQAGIRLMPSGAIPGNKIEINTISGDKLEKNSVTGGLDGKCPRPITADNIADNAVGADELADLSVDTAALQSGAVTGDKVAENTWRFSYRPERHRTSSLPMQASTLRPCRTMRSQAQNSTLLRLIAALI